MTKRPFLLHLKEPNNYPNIRILPQKNSDIRNFAKANKGTPLVPCDKTKIRMVITNVPRLAMKKLMNMFGYAHMRVLDFLKRIIFLTSEKLDDEDIFEEVVELYNSDAKPRLHIECTSRFEEVRKLIHRLEGIDRLVLFCKDSIKDLEVPILELDESEIFERKFFFEDLTDSSKRNIPNMTVNFKGYLMDLREFLENNDDEDSLEILQKLKLEKFCDEREIIFGSSVKSSIAIKCEEETPKLATEKCKENSNANFSQILDTVDFICEL